MNCLCQCLKLTPPTVHLSTSFLLLKDLDTTIISCHSNTTGFSLSTELLSSVYKLTILFILHLKIKSPHSYLPLDSTHLPLTTTLFVSSSLQQNPSELSYIHGLQFCTSKSLLNPLQSDVHNHHSTETCLKVSNNFHFNKPNGQVSVLIFISEGEFIQVDDFSP